MFFFCFFLTFWKCFLKWDTTFYIVRGVIVFMPVALISSFGPIYYNRSVCNEEQGIVFSKLWPTSFWLHQSWCLPEWNIPIMHLMMLPLFQFLTHVCMCILNLNICVGLHMSLYVSYAHYFPRVDIHMLVCRYRHRIFIFYSCLSFLCKALCDK